MFLFLAAMGLAASAVEWAQLPDGVRLTGRDGEADVFAFTLAPDSPFMNGNLPRMGKDVELRFATPLDASAADRVIYEARGVTVDDRHHQSAAELRPMIEDAEGEVFDLLPQSVKMLVGDDARQIATGKGVVDGSWREYATGCWFAGEAGAASHGLYTVAGAGDGRPTRPLKFVGFRLHVVREAPEGRADVPGYAERLAASRAPLSGEVRLAAVRLANGVMPFEYPFAFSDNMCKREGRYRFAAAVTEDFQAEPIGGVDFAFDYRTGERRRLEVPTGPDGVYWIRWTLTDEDAGGKEVASGAKRVQTLGNGKVEKRVEKVERVEGLRVRHQGRGVFEKGEPFEMTVVGLRGEEAEYVLEPYASRDVLARGTVPADGRLAFPRTPGVCVYRLRVNRMKGGSVVETAEFLFGERTDPACEHSRAGKVISRNELKDLPYNRFTYHVSTKHQGKHGFDWLEGDFVRFLKETRAWLQNYTISADLVDFEVLPGVYDFTLLDRYMDIAADWGVKLTVKLDHADWYAGEYRWNKYSHQYSFDNTLCGYGNPCGVFAACDRGLLDLFARANRALYDRYRRHTAFQGYYVCQPASEFTVVDQPWMGSVSGYSPEETRGFRDWLVRQGKKPFDPPRPNYALGATPDLSPEWVAFSRFKQNLARSWYVNLLSAIRAFDTNRVTIAYGVPSLSYAGLLDFAHNGGNARMDNRGEFIEAWEKGRIGWITEPIHPHFWAAAHVPGAEGWTLDASVWSMLAQAGAGGANLHLYSFTDSGEKAHVGLGYAHDRMRRYLPLLEEIHDARIIQPASEVATYAGWDTMLLKHRAYFGARLADLRRWLDLVTNDGFLPSKLDKFPDRAFKLVVPNAMDEVIPASAYTNIVRQVRDFGATCLMTARTGRYVTEFGVDDEFPLLKAFGIPLPKGEWKTDGEGVAKVPAGCPLFPEGHRLAFQTLTRLRRETHDAKILADFNSYPYRWVPETDYFGYYPEMPAVSVHPSGKGKVIVFWGLPAMTDGALKGMIAKAAAFAGVTPSKAEVGDWFEMHGDDSGRHYGFFYLETTYGPRRLVFPNCPDGTYFANDMVSDRKYGLYSGRFLREEGIAAKWEHGDSPLKAIRLIQETNVPWIRNYEVKK
mgnify:CR=1 FL=1